MTGIYTEDTLKAFSKTHLFDLFLKMQDKANSTIDSLTAKMKDLNNSFTRLESDVQIVKIVNNNLLKQLENTERQHLMLIKKGLNNLNPTNLSFPEGTKIYVNNSLCSYYRGLWNEC